MILIIVAILGAAVFAASVLSAENSRLKRAADIIAFIFAWIWALVAGVGGLMLLIHEGPLPITNGWFALFSGIAACPLTAILLKKYAHVRVSGRVQFYVAFAIFLAGRVAVAVILHRPFLPQCSGKCW